MSRSERSRRWRKVAATAFLVGAGIGVTQAAHAAHTPCDNEGLAGGDFGADIGPGITFVGVDALGDPSVCVTTGAPVGESNESVTLNVEDPNPATPGATVALDRRSCVDQAGLSCTTTSVVGQTGVEDVDASPTTDLPGGGTAGAGLLLGTDCIWVNGTATCGGPSVTVTAWEGELPQTSSGGCLVDAPPSAGCDLAGIRVSAFGTPDPLVRASRAGMPGVGDGNTDAAPAPTCTGVGTTCP